MDAAQEFAADLGWAEEEQEEGPLCPDELVHVMGYFYELAAARPAGFAGPSAISYSDIESWLRLTGRTVDPFEVQCITAIDGEFRKAAATASRRNKNHG